MLFLTIIGSGVIASLYQRWSELADRTAIICDGAYISYNQMLRRVEGIRRHFESQDLEAGSSVAVCLPNSDDFVYTYIACLIGGYTIVPINIQLPKCDIDYILDVVHPDLVIETSDDVRVAEREPNASVRLHPDNVFAIFFTSGTTGRPKGVCHSASAMVGNAESFNALVGLNEETKMLHVMPMGYMAGFLNTVLCPLVAGGTVVIATRFEGSAALSFWETPMRYGINAMWITPTMAALLARLNRDCNVPSWTRTHLSHVLVGTAPLFEEIKRSFQDTFKVECLESYGMTEALFVSTNTPSFIKKKASVGRILDGITVEARSEDGIPLPQGEEGALWLRSPFAAQGFLHPESREISSLLEDDWMPTGDLGYVDSDNDLFITGRLKDLIIHGGVNVSPRAVEEVLILHPDVKDAAIIGAPHDLWGEEVIAFLVMEDSADFDKRTFTRYCQRDLSSDAVPTNIKILNSMPRSSTGKIQKQALRGML